MIGVALRWRPRWRPPGRASISPLIPVVDRTELFKQFSDNPAFKKWLSDSIFAVTCQGQADETHAG